MTEGSPTGAPIQEKLARSMRVFVTNYPPGSRLKSEEQYGTIFNTSGSNMHSALDILTGQGLVERKREGIFVRQTVKQWLAANILNDIITGTYRPGDSLPQPEILQEHYGVSRNTVSQAYKILGNIIETPRD